MSNGSMSAPVVLVSGRPLFGLAAVGQVQEQVSPGLTRTFASGRADRRRAPVTVAAGSG